MYLHLFEGMHPEFFYEFAFPFCDNKKFEIQLNTNVLRGHTIGDFVFNRVFQQKKFGLLKEDKTEELRCTFKAPISGEVIHALRPFAFFTSEVREIVFFDDSEFNRNHVALGILSSNKKECSPWELHKDFFDFIRDNENTIYNTLISRNEEKILSGWLERLKEHEKELKKRQCPIISF